MIFTKANLTSLLPLYDETTPDAGQGYHYYFPNSPEMAHDRTTLRRLDRLAQSVRDSVALDLSAETATLAQFIAQDISGDVGLGAMQTAPSGPNPMARCDVIHGMANTRSGAMDLDTVYAGCLKQGNYGRKLTALLRDPKDKTKLLDTRFMTLTEQAEGQCEPFAMATASPQAAQTCDDIRDLFFHMDANGTLHRPGGHCPLGLGGEPQEAQSVAAMHRTLLQFHNAIAGTYGEHALGARGSDALFDRARDHVRWQYQWLVVNVFLRQICHAETLDQVIADEAPLYRQMASAVPVDPKGHLPIPLEFSAAAFRVLEAGAATDAMRTSHHLNLPSAQSCLAEIAQTTGLPLQSLSVAQLTSGRTGAALDHAGFVQDTPLWFYIHKEAEILGKGETLGPLGSALVANTLLGLLVVDDWSYWHQGTAARKEWSPAEGLLPDGRKITSLTDLREALT